MKASRSVISIVLAACFALTLVPLGEGMAVYGLRGHLRWAEKATVKSMKVDFAAAVQEYQAVQAEFLARVGDHEVAALEIRRRIAELILQCANAKKQPFEVCQHLWEEMLKAGFTDISRRCTMSWFFADCCRMHGQVDLGLGVLEPLFAEIQQLLAAPAITETEVECYRYELDNLGKLRAALEALRMGAPSTP